MREVFNLNKISSEQAGEMTTAQIEEIKSIASELASLEGLIADNSDTWVVEHLSTTLDDLREVLGFIKSKKK